MPERRATLVLSGGGAKGAFQVGVEQVLRREGGFVWERIFGVSVGALNGAMLAQRAYDELAEVWRTVKEKEVYKKAGWLKVAWRLAVQKKTGLYDGTPLRALIDREIGGRPFRVPLHVGRVSLTSGVYELVDHTSPDILDAIWQSATMPVIWEPIGDRALVDGGVRNVTPLGDALKFESTALVVILCNPWSLEPVTRPKDILAAVKRALADITINEIFRGDIREFVRINRLVRDASAKGVILRDRQGRPYRNCPIHLLYPAIQLGDSLDFSQAAIERRLAMGITTAREFLSHGTPAQ